MSSVGRITLWATGALLLAVGGGVLLLIGALDGKLEPACLDTVAPAPDGAFYRPPARADGRLVVDYDDGLSLAVPRAPARIVSTLPGITEMLLHLGARERLVAVSPYCDLPADAEGIARVQVQPFDAEAVLAQRADLLIADRRLHRRDLGVMRSRVRAILLLDTSRSLAHLGASMALLAEVLDTGQARARAAAFRDRAAAVTARLARGAPQPPPRVLVVAQWDPLYVLGRGSLIDDLLRICGCVNVACDLKSDASGTFSEELVLARRPDWIVWTTRPPPARLRARWRHVPAIAAGRLVAGAGDDLVRAGPRTLAALERLAAALGRTP